MKLKLSICLIAAVTLLFGCSSEKKSSLEGVWQFVSGEYTSEGTTMLLPGSDDFISYKFIGKTRWAVLTQDTSQDIFLALSGTYKLEGDTYTESIEIADISEGIGNSITYTCEIRDDLFTITRSKTDAEGNVTLNHHEVWKKVE